MPARPHETKTDLSLSEARRLALAARGFDRPRPKRPPGPRDLGRVIRQLGLLQIDFVNVLAPAHYQVPFSRLGPYPRALASELAQWARWLDLDAVLVEKRGAFARALGAAGRQAGA